MRRSDALTISYWKKVDRMKDHSFFMARTTASLAVVVMLIAAGIMVTIDSMDESAEGASSIGSITVTGGNKKTYEGVNYLLDGDISVSGSGSKLTFLNSTIALSQDVGSDGILGGGDDHIYQIDVSNGGILEFINSKLTTQTGQLKPYFMIDIEVSGTGSEMVLDDSAIEGPGTLEFSNNAHLEMSRSKFIELKDQDDISYDIDGDGGSGDDVDYNDDGILLSLLSGSTGNIVDSEIRDTFSFNVGSRDGRTAGNITLDGSGTNLTLINSFIDVDLESNFSTGSHNILKISNGAVAHLVGTSINLTDQPFSPAIVVEDSDSSALYYRWIAAHILDGMNIQVEDQEVQVFRVEGTQNKKLDNSYLTDEILEYMGRSRQNWSDTSSEGWAFIPVMTDLFSLDSMPNSNVTPDFSVRISIGTETLSASTSFDSYPDLPGQGDQAGLIAKIKKGEDIPENILSDLGGTLSFSKHVITPSSSSYFEVLDTDMTINGNTFIKGTGSLIDGKFYPSYYAFDGHVIVTSGGKLVINDTTVNFLTDDGPAYILIENGGIVELNNVSLSSRGKGDLYLYLLGSGSPTFMMDGGDLTIKHIVARDTANLEVNADNMKGSLNLYGSSVSAGIDAERIDLDGLFSHDNDLRLGGGNVTFESLDWSGVDFQSENSTFSRTLDVDGSAELTNVTYTGNLTQGRTSWIRATGSGQINRYYWANSKVVDSVENPLPVSNIDVLRVVGDNEIPVSSHTTDEMGSAIFKLLQEEIRSTGRNFLGNYRLMADYKGLTSQKYSAIVAGSDVDAMITIPGGPDVHVKSLRVEGTLISGNDVIILANVTNKGEFDAGPFDVELQVGGFIVDSIPVDGLKAGNSTSVGFPWRSEEGELEFVVIVDPYQALRETDEVNNLFTQVNMIGMGPDYEIDLIENNTEWVYGEKGSFDIKITNIGDPDPSATPFVVNVSWFGDIDSGIIEKDIEFQYIEPGLSMIKSIDWTPMEVGQVTITAEIDAEFDQVPLNSIKDLDIVVKNLPELSIVQDSVTIDSPIPVTINKTRIISFTIKNSGEMPSGQFKVLAYDGEIIEEDLITPLPIMVQALEPGESTSLEFQWFAGLPIGTHDIKIVVDADNQVMEQFEDNNVFQFPVEVDTPPDVTFNGILGISPNVITEGKNTTFWAWIENIGNTLAENVKVHFAVDSDVNVIAETNIDLSPGEITNVSFQWSASGVGEHTLFVLLDPFDRIIEEGSGEENNLAFRIFNVLSKPDLYMGDNDLRVLPEERIFIDQEVKLFATIRNSGQTDAENIFVRFYDGDPDEGGKIIPWKPTQPSAIIDRIEAGSASSIEVPWIPRSGDYHEIFVVMDLSDLIDESNEDNNKLNWDIYVQTLPDLVFTSIEFYQGSISVNSSGVGKELKINATLENIGDTSSPSFRVSFYNGDFINDPLSVKIGNDIMFPSNILSGHSSRYIEIDWEVSYPKGIRTLYASVELMDGTEQMVTNNQFGKNLEIFDIMDVPEIRMEDETFMMASRYPGMSPQETGIGFKGTNISLSINLSNVGGKASSNTTILFMVSNSTDSWVEYSTYIEFIENNGSDMVTGFWMLDSVGMNTLSIIVDPENRIREFDEGNNIFEVEIEVLESPDLVVDLVEEDSQGWNSDKGKFEMTKGKEYIVVYEITNTGNFTYTDVDVGFTGPAITDRQTVTISPFGTQRVTFTVKPDTVFSEDVAWKCKVNEEGRVFESDADNNEALGLFKINEKEQEVNYLVFVLIILFILVLIIVGVGIFVYMRLQSADKAKCSNCGGLVPLDATVCPHCGVEFSDELECECGEPIPKGATECPACGKPVSSDLLAQEEEEEKIEEGEEEGELEELEGEDLEEEDVEKEEEALDEAPGDEIPAQPEGAEEELAECFECGALIPVSAPICPHCGAVFE
jgi:subtilase family serine protease